MRRRYTGKQRSELIDLVTTGRATVSEAAKRLEAGASTAYHWMREAGAGSPRRRRAERHALPRRTRPLVPPTFVRLVRAGDLAATISVRVGSSEIEVRSGFDADLLRVLVSDAIFEVSHKGVVVTPRASRRRIH